MASKKAQDVTPESVDDMTDEQLDEFRASMDQEPADETQENAAPEGKDEAQEGETAKPDAKAEETEKAASEGEENASDEPEDGEKAENVPFKRFDYERNRRKQAEKLNQEDREKWQKRFDELLARTQPPQSAAPEQPKPEVPDSKLDPLAALGWTQEQILQMQERQKAETETQKQQREQYEFVQQLTADAQVEFAEAEKADPTTREAYDAVIKSFQAEAQAYRVPPAQMQQHLQQTELQHIAYARQHNIPLADYVKALASARGWRPAAAQTEPQPETQGNGNVEAKRAEAQKRSKTLSNGGGSPGVSDGLSPEQILDMSDKDFDAMVEKYGSVAGALAAQ